MASQNVQITNSEATISSMTVSSQSDSCRSSVSERSLESNNSSVSSAPSPRRVRFDDHAVWTYLDEHKQTSASSWKEAAFWKRLRRNNHSGPLLPIAAPAQYPGRASTAPSSPITLQAQQHSDEHVASIGSNRAPRPSVQATRSEPTTVTMRSVKRPLRESFERRPCQDRKAGAKPPLSPLWAQPRNGLHKGNWSELLG